jgi:hypothetical protein
MKTIRNEDGSINLKAARTKCKKCKAQAQFHDQFKDEARYIFRSEWPTFCMKVKLDD